MEIATCDVILIDCVRPDIFTPIICLGVFSAHKYVSSGMIKTIYRSFYGKKVERYAYGML